MQHLKTGYRISLLRAAAFHGASHQAAMVFQVIVPKQMRKGRWRRTDVAGLCAILPQGGGIIGLAQIAKDAGGHAKPATLAKLAIHYENASVRRLGYLLERMGRRRQAAALQSFAAQAKSAVPLDPSLKPLIEGLAAPREKAPRPDARRFEQDLISIRARCDLFKIVSLGVLFESCGQVGSGPY